MGFVRGCRGSAVPKKGLCRYPSRAKFLFCLCTISALARWEMKAVGTEGGKGVGDPIPRVGGEGGSGWHRAVSTHL